MARTEQHQWLRPGWNIRPTAQTPTTFYLMRPAEPCHRLGEAARRYTDHALVWVYLIYNSQLAVDPGVICLSPIQPGLRSHSNNVSTEETIGTFSESCLISKYASCLRRYFQEREVIPHTSVSMSIHLVISTKQFRTRFLQGRCGLLFTIISNNRTMPYLISQSILIK